MRLPLLALFSMALSSANAIGQPVVPVVTTDFPPYSYPSGDRTGGLATDLVQLVCQRAAVQCVIDVLPWARAYQMARTTPGTLIYAIARTPQREADFQWIGTISPYEVMIWKARDNAKIQPSATLDALKTYLVGGQLQDVKSLYLDEHGFQIEWAADQPTNIRKLLAGRIDLVPGDRLSFVHRVNTMGFDTKDVTPVYRIAELSHDLYLAAQNDTDPAIVSRLVVALDELKRDGGYMQVWHDSATDQSNTLPR